VSRRRPGRPRWPQRSQPPLNPDPKTNERLEQVQRLSWRLSIYFRSRGGKTPGRPRYRRRPRRRRSAAPRGLRHPRPRPMLMFVNLFKGVGVSEKQNSNFKRWREFRFFTGKSGFFPGAILLRRTTFPAGNRRFYLFTLWSLCETHLQTCTNYGA
jgi:hypothetical protein